jgi:hypothetical protein
MVLLLRFSMPATDGRLPRVWSRVFPYALLIWFCPRVCGGRVVEVAGIEPASFVASTGLLRAQRALSLLDPTGLAHEPV